MPEMSGSPADVLLFAAAAARGMLGSQQDRLLNRPDISPQILDALSFHGLGPLLYTVLAAESDGGASARPGLLESGYRTSAKRGLSAEHETRMSAAGRLREMEELIVRIGLGLEGLGRFLRHGLGPY